MPVNEIGERLDGRYELLELIGEGGMANVFKAEDLLEHRAVAVKILKEECMRSEELVRRFKNESRAISVLNHPNIVKVFDVSVSDKMQYIVMEYIDGITLKEYIEQRGEPLTYKECVHFITQVLQALQHAHDKGIVHRDIKPQNIMITEDGTVKVMDFGIARLSRSESHTATDQAIGSVHYISPEQAQGDSTDLRADIYSAGIMLYEMLTGTLPFESDNAVSIALKQISDQAPPMRQINPSVPEGLVDITMKAMAKEPRRRYQSALEMQRDIEEFKRNPSIKFEYDYLSGGEPTRYMEKMSKPSLKQPPAKKSGRRPAKKKRGILVPAAIGITLAVVLVCALIVINIFQNTGTPLFGSVENIEFPNFVGQNVDDVLLQLKQPPYQNLGAPEIIVDENIKTDAEGTILSQNPTPKTIKANQKGIVFHVSSGIKDVVVPETNGMTRSEASAALTKVGLMPYFKIVVDSGAAKGTVVGSDPAAGQTKTNRTNENLVTVYIAADSIASKVTVPDLVGLASPDEAKVLLSQKKLELVSVYKEEFNDAPAGTIISQSPEKDTEVYEYTNVRITISKGPEPPPIVMVPVPNLFNRTEEEASSALAGLGLLFDIERQYSNDVPMGRVISQSVAPDTSVEQGSAVKIVVSLGRDPAQVPSSSSAPTPPSIPNSVAADGQRGQGQGWGQGQAQTG